MTITLDSFGQPVLADRSPAPRDPARPQAAPESAATPPLDAGPLDAGPLVAVCGLAGGAGTTLLSWLLARAAVAAGDAPVLLADLPGGGGGIAALTGAGGSLAQALDGPPGTRAWTDAPGGPDGLRVAAVAPAAAADDLPAERIARTLDAARGEHARVVVDCGRLHAADARATLAVASHVVWTVPAGPGAGETARSLLLDSDLAPPPGGAVELLVAVATRPAVPGARGQRALREVVAERGERLVLVPHVRELAGAAAGAAGGKAPRRLAAAVSAIAGVLTREQPA